MSEQVGTLVERQVVSQDAILAVQEFLLKGPTLDIAEENFFAEGIYARLIKVPAGMYIVGKAHRTQHLSIMLKGKAMITRDDGSVYYEEAPFIAVTPAGKKKMAFVLEEMWFANIHPTDTEDLEVIESRVIIPEAEYKALLEQQKQERLGAKES